MATWILILAIIGAGGEVRQLAPVAAPFVSADACNAAGVLASASLPNVRHPREAVWHRVDWVCLPNGTTAEPSVSDAVCKGRAEAREAAREKLREELKAVRAELRAEREASAP